MLIDRITSDEVLEQAYQWLCEKRAHYHFNGDVWQKTTLVDGEKSLCAKAVASWSVSVSGIAAYSGPRKASCRDRTMVED